VSAEQLLTALFNAGIAISIGATVLSLGMTFTVAQLIAPLRRVGLVVAMVVLSAVVIPAVAWGVATVLPIKGTYVDGLVLATLGAGSAGGIKAAQLSKRADLPLAVSMVVVLQLVNIVSVPLWAGQVVSGASLSAWDILKSLLELVLIPLIVGLIAGARYADHAGEWKDSLTKVANAALVVALAAGICVNWQTIVDLFGSWVLVASIVIIAIALALGMLLGRDEAETRTTTGLVTSMRFGSLGLIIIGTQLNGSADYLGPALVFTLLDFVLPLVLAIEIGRKTRTGPSTDGAAASARRHREGVTLDVKG
jgi:BASS family bile acid:Na+ symporter